MTGAVVLDTGSLVAVLNRRDRYHRWATEQWGEIEPPLLTCEPGLAEACYLLRDVAGGRATVLELVSRDVVTIPFRIDAEAGGIARLLERYADLPASLADVCLVRMIEQHPGSRVLTLDRDFRVYRVHGRRVIPTLMPADL